MKVLTVLRYVVNFVFFAFILSAFAMLVLPFYDQSYTNYNPTAVFWLLLVFPLIHVSIIFMILFYLRKFVHNSAVGTPLDASTRKYLKRSGIFCLLYGLLRIPEFTAMFTFYKVTGELNSTLISNVFLDFGSLFYIILIGIFFIYLSKVLESSDEIRQENKLTI